MIKILNILLCILIFILAALSAASSYFLYEKRTQMISGWDKMAQSINATAKVLDSGAGTKTASTLSPDALGHKNYADLDSKLPALKKQADAVVKQRNDLVKSIRQIAGVMEVLKYGDNAAFQDLEKYAGSSSKLVRDIKDIKERNDDCLNKVAQVAGKVGIRMTAEDLKSSQYSSNLDTLSRTLGEMEARRATFNKYMVYIAGQVGVTKKAVENDKKEYYTKALDKVYTGVRQIKRELSTTKKQLASANRKIKGYGRSVSQKDNKIASLNDTIKDRDTEIRSLKKIIAGVDTAVIPKPWVDGSKDVRSATKGAVVEVSRKFGFVVVDLGANATVKQRIGKKINYVNPEVKTGDQFVVIRNLDSGSPQFIGKIKLVKVDENCSIANVVAGSTSGSDIKVGDSIVFASTI